MSQWKFNLSWGEKVWCCWISSNLERTLEVNKNKRNSQCSIQNDPELLILYYFTLQATIQIQLVQELNSNDQNVCCALLVTMPEYYQNLNNYVFADKTHFHLNRHVNKQNFLYWTGDNLKLKHQNCVHWPKVLWTILFHEIISFVIKVISL